MKFKIEEYEKLVGGKLALEVTISNRSSFLIGQEDARNIANLLIEASKWPNKPRSISVEV